MEYIVDNGDELYSFIYCTNSRKRFSKSPLAKLFLVFSEARLVSGVLHKMTFIIDSKTFQ